MPYLKVTFDSPSNANVGGSVYVEVAAEDMDAFGDVLESVKSAIWQEAVNEFMRDTYTELVDEEGA